MLCITLVVVYSSKPGVDGVSGMVLSGGYFGVTWVGNKLGISDGEVLCTTI